MTFERSREGYLTYTWRDSNFDTELTIAAYDNPGETALPFSFSTILLIASPYQLLLVKKE
jgi:hypothetical protein